MIGKYSAVSFALLSGCLLLSSLDALSQKPAALERDPRENHANMPLIGRDNEMVRIRGAAFELGTPASDIDKIAREFGIEKHPDLIAAETPRQAVTLKSYYIDKFEVTNAQFARFLAKHAGWRKGSVPKDLEDGSYLTNWAGADPPHGKDDHPVINITWHAAVAYCESVGKRLPTEAEWEYAARGGLIAKTFPWGDEPVDRSRANYSGSGINGPAKVGSYAPNGYGLYDMAGNVWEFVADEWRPYGPIWKPTDPAAERVMFLNESYLNVTTRRVIRGGSWGGSPVNLRITYRDSHPPNAARDFVGFRCAK